MTAVSDPQWLLDIVAPSQVYSSDAAIMTRAIELTLASIQRGEGGPFGAIIATEPGEIVAIAHNEVWQALDPTGHAEIIVIRRAAQTLNHLTIDEVDGARLRLFTTCEPCAMCHVCGCHFLGSLAHGVCRDAERGCSVGRYAAGVCGHDCILFRSGTDWLLP